MIKKIKNNILVTICAKGNSKGLKNKNIKKFYGKELIIHALDKVINNDFKYICISTESKKIQNIVKKKGIQTFFTRSVKLTRSNVAKEDVWKDAILKSQNYFKKKFKYFLDIEVTNPLLTKKDLNNFLKKFFNTINYKKLNGAFYICEARKSPYFNILKKINTGYDVCIKSKNNIFSRQKAPKTYEHVAGFYLFTVKHILQTKKNNIFGKKVLGFEIPFHKTIDIDSKEDFLLSKIIYKYFKI
ncbi:acylneuraminate cytidylyltransferase family protein [Candidatus Pelagibacter sp.]|nr:acylneuraminate cytidylyltransferase family protein [Candidatus Pelagibacter sp.]